MDRLAERIRKNRQAEVESGGFKFTIRRLTTEEVGRFWQSAEWSSDLIARCIVGWTGVLKSTLANGEPDEPAPYSQELAAEWLADRMDLWPALTSKIWEITELHLKQQQDALKN